MSVGRSGTLLQVQEITNEVSGQPVFFVLAEDQKDDGTKSSISFGVIPNEKDLPALRSLANALSTEGYFDPSSVEVSWDYNYANKAGLTGAELELLISNSWDVAIGGGFHGETRKGSVRIPKEDLAKRIIQIDFSGYKTAGGGMLESVTPVDPHKAAKEALKTANLTAFLAAFYAKETAQPAEAAKPADQRVVLFPGLNS